MKIMKIRVLFSKSVATDSQIKRTNLWLLK